MSEKFYISWEEFHKDSQELSKKIKLMDLNIKGIVCITRGGLVPSAIIASELDIRKIETYGIKTYSDSHEQEKNYEILSIPVEALKDHVEGWSVTD